MGARWGIYARISRAANGETLGVERQEPPTRALVERMGGEVRQVYVDNDLSAYSGKRRPAYERLLSDVRSGQIDGIAAWHPDRLTRQPIENETLISLVEEHGTQVATALVGDHDLSTPSGRMMFRMLGTLARYESEHRAERQMAKQAELAGKGAFGGGSRPFGFEADGVTIRQAEAEVIREAARRVLSGESLGRVVSDLKARGIRTAQGAAWHTTTMRRLLVSPRVAGLREHHGQVVGQAAWDAILDEATWNGLRGLFSDRSGRKTAGRPAAYVFSGLLACGLCGGRMIGDSRGARAKGYGCVECGKTWISAAPVERELEGRVIGTLASKSFRDAARQRLEAELGGVDVQALDMARAELADYQALPTRFRTAETDQRVSELEGIVAEAERQMAALPAASGLLDVLDRLEAAWQRVAEATAEGRGLVVEVTADAQAFARLVAAWQALPVELRRTAVEATIEITTVGPATANRRDVVGRLSGWEPRDGASAAASAVLASMLNERR